MEQAITKKPVFEEFRQLFLEEINLINGSNIQDSFYHWNKIGDKEMRLNIINSFCQKVQDIYGFEIEKVGHLANLDGLIESVVVQIYHNFSTMHLVERINAKIRAKMN